MGADCQESCSTMDTASWSELPFQVVVKPIGPICNLRCTYCFYLGTEMFYPKGEAWRMSDETLQTFVRQYVDAQPHAIPDIFFSFQGGEPTLMGLDFYRRVVELQQKCVPPEKRISNLIQTNGVLLDDEWCEFLEIPRVPCRAFSRRTGRVSRLVPSGPVGPANI